MASYTARKLLALAREHILENTSQNEVYDARSSFIDEVDAGSLDLYIKIRARSDENDKWHLQSARNMVRYIGRESKLTSRHVRGNSYWVEFNDVSDPSIIAVKGKTGRFIWIAFGVVSEHSFN
jgi:hypothetical protein